MLKANQYYLVRPNEFIKCQAILRDCSIKVFLQKCNISGGKNYNKDKFTKNETHKLSTFLNMDRTAFLKSEIPFKMPEQVTLYQYIQLERVINFENIPQYEFAYIIGLTRSNKPNNYNKINNYLTSKPNGRDYKLLAEAFNMNVLELRNLPIKLKHKQKNQQPKKEIQTELHEFVDYNSEAKLADLEFKQQEQNPIIVDDAQIDSNNKFFTFTQEHSKLNSREPEQLNLFLQLLTNQDENGLTRELSESGINELIINKLLNGETLTEKQMKLIIVAIS